MNHLSFVTTSDGSKSIYNAEIGENYHSKHGALNESRHVFVNSGLGFYLDKYETGEAKILEAGFGTGLNFLLSADYCLANNISLQYTGIEAFPLTDAMISQTGYDSYIPSELWSAFLQNYQASFQQQVNLTNHISLQNYHGTLMDFQSAEAYDIIYFDAFAAIHQPEMWTDESLGHISSFLKPGGVFVTYAITGNLKRSMKSLGFTVEKAPGAPGKREMLRAVKI